MNDSTGQVPPDVPQPDSPPPDPFQQSDQPGSQPQPAKKSRRKWWIITSVMLLLVLVVGGLGFFVVLPAIQQSSLESTLQTYCNAVKKLDAQELSSTFSSSFKAHPRNGGSNLFFTFGMMKYFGVTITSCTVGNIQQHGSTATATIMFTLLSAQGQSTTTVQTVSLIVENWVWRVNDINGESLISNRHLLATAQW